jgi:hypothetical protein
MNTTKQQEKKTYTRRMPIEGSLMKYDVNDIFYTLMYCLATYNPTDKRLYLAKKTFTANKRLIYDSCGFNGSPMMKRHLTRLIERDLIVEDETNYYFPQNQNEKYHLIEKDMLFCLATTRSLNSIRIYLILLDGYLWKKKEKEEFNFTNSFLLEKMGYSTNNKEASRMVTEILESLAREGIIKFEEKYELIITKAGKEVPSPKKYLKFVATKKSELKN